MIFLSYASEDKAVAELIAFSLKGRGYKVFFDRDNLALAASYDQHIESAVNKSKAFVFLISPDSVEEGRYSLSELTFARRKWPHPNGRVLPVMVRKTPLEKVPPYLRAVSILQPVGNIAAETSSAVHNMLSLRRRWWDLSLRRSWWDGFFAQYFSVLGRGSILGIGAALAVVLIALGVGPPSVNGWHSIDLGTPFYLAVVTYSVFAYLDKEASAQATKVITSWLQGHSLYQPDLGNLIIDAFDIIYTSPLLTIKALVRSAAITSVIWFAVFLVPMFMGISSAGHNLLISKTKINILEGIVLNWLIIVLTDYHSLLLVRRSLIVAKNYPITAALVSSAVGLLVVSAYGVFFGTLLIMTDIIDAPNIALTDIPYTTQIVMRLYFYLSFLRLMVPAFIIHLWLPLFALSSLFARLVYLIFTAVERAHLLPKQGDAHPLKLIGIGAAIIVFGSAILVKEGWALLGVLERS